MKDIRIPQLIFNDMTKEQYDSITPAENEFYITDEVNVEIPIGFGMWASNEIGDNWAPVSDDYVNGSDYPLLWEVLKGVNDGSVMHDGMHVLTADQVATKRANAKDWELANLERHLAYCYIINLDTEKFKFPRCIENRICVGDDDPGVYGDENNYGGCYSISSQGKYCEVFSFIRLVKATKTVGDKSYTYYKATQWHDSSQEIPVVTEGNTVKTYSLNATITRNIINSKYALTFTNNLFHIDSNSTINNTMYGIYTKVSDLEKGVQEFSAVFELYDEELETSESLAIIPEGHNEIMIVCVLEGYVDPPLVADYNTGRKLYIKVA